MAKNKKTESEGEVVDLAERVTVYPTSSAPYHQKQAETGESITCSRLVANKMIANGWATVEPQVDKKKGGKKADDLL